MSPLTAEAICAGLDTRWLARALVCLPSTDSTMRVVAEQALRGAPHGAAVIAEEQTAGRGRLGRSFYSPPGSRTRTASPRMRNSASKRGRRAGKPPEANRSSTRSRLP